MTLADLGNLGEFIASVVVVLSLIYLATQVRQNSRLLRASAIQSAASNTASGFVSTLAQSLETSAVATKGLEDFGSLTQAEATQFSALLFLVFTEVESAYLLHQESALPDSLWQSRASILQFYLRTPGGRDAWHIWSGLVDKSFSDYVERELLIKNSEK